MIIEQFLPALHYGDAVGDSALTLHRYAASRGVESRIIALTRDESVKDLALGFEDYRENPRSLKILHYAVASPLTDFFRQAPGKKAMIYHNVTPSHFFVDFSDFLVRFTREGREHLRRLTDSFDLAVAVSRYNAAELTELGFPRVTVFPLLANLDAYDGEYSRAFFEQLRDERRNLLFVGRLTPNKKIEDLIKMVFFYKKYLSSAVRLVVVGNPRTLPVYARALNDLAARFLLTAEDVVFTGHLPFAELLAAYRAADLFVSMSEHEGFCLPLLESCHFGLPVLAYAAAAVPETLAGAGVLFSDKRSDRVAALAEKIVEDEPLRSVLAERGRQRVVQYRREADPALLLRQLEAL